jgi:hypothetical protein
MIYRNSIAVATLAAAVCHNAVRAPAHDPMPTNKDRPAGPATLQLGAPVTAKEASSDLFRHIRAGSRCCCQSEP